MSAPAMATLTAAVHSANIEVGLHHTVQFLGLTFNVDTIWSTLVAGVIVLGLGLIVARSATSGVPGKLQLTWESLVNWISQLVRDNIGHTDRNVIQLAIMLFTLILISNWLELIPSSEWLIAPTVGPEHDPGPGADRHRRACTRAASGPRASAATSSTTSSRSRCSSR